MNTFYNCSLTNGKQVPLTDPTINSCNISATHKIGSAFVRFIDEHTNYFNQCSLWNELQPEAFKEENDTTTVSS